jgi:hypothetical protein
MLRSLVRRACLAALAALALGLLAVPAGAATVTGGSFDWSMDNFYESSANDTLFQRTFLGFVTNRLPIAGPPSEGTVTTSAGATILDRRGVEVADVSPDSPRGVGQSYTFRFPAAGGTFDPRTATGSVQLNGTVSFGVMPRFGLQPNTIVNPTLTLDGLRADLTASGQVTIGVGPNPTAYGAEFGPLFSFDLTRSLLVRYADGSLAIRAAKRSAQRGDFFGPPFGAAGTESFELHVTLPPGASDGTQGPAGPAGPAGRAGANGKDGKTIRVQTSLLRKAPFAGKASHAITLRKDGDVVARGSVRKRLIRVQLAEDQTKALRGVYTLRAGKASQKVRVL